MHKTTSKKQLSDEEFAYKVIYTVPCKGDEASRKAEAYRILVELSGNPGLLDAGPVFFQSMKMAWNGEVWTIELEGKD